MSARKAREVALALKENSSLTSLNMAFNGIGPDGAREVAMALLENSTLTSLSLGYNVTGNEAMKELGMALQKNSGLTSLGLHVCDALVSDGSLLTM